MVYDLIITGSGPAGLTAGLYAARYNLKTLIIGEISGGLAAEAIEVCNFPSHGRISGLDLMQKMEEQVKELGVEIRKEVVKNIEGNDSGFLVNTPAGKYEAKNVILAMGIEKRKLGLEKEDKFIGKGVSYCATCDAAFYRDKEAAVVGGSDAALTSSLLLSKFAKKVYLVYRKEKFFRAFPALVKEVEKNDKIEVIFKAEVIGLKGEDFLESVELNNGEWLKAEGLFIEIGGAPASVLAKDLGVKVDEKRFIKVNKKQETNVKGVFACGDVTDNVLKQIVTACGEGAVAALGAYQRTSQNG
jgi:thioredoxin reductase (NADPH)